MQRSILSLRSYRVSSTSPQSLNNFSRFNLYTDSMTPSKDQINNQINNQINKSYLLMSSIKLLATLISKSIKLCHTL